MAEDTEVIVHLTHESASLVVQAQAFECKTPKVYEKAGSFLKDLKALKQEIKETFGPMKRKTDAAHKEVVAQEKTLLAPIEVAERTVKSQMSGYLQRCDQERRALQAKAAAEARKEEEENRLEYAVELEEAGNTEEARQVLDEPTVEAPPPPVPGPPKVAGVSHRDKWTAEVTDFAAVVTAVAARQAPIAVLTIDQASLNKLAETHKQGLEIPGVKVRCEKIIAARASGG